MGDTQTLERGITPDAPPRLRLTDAAVKRLMRATGIKSVIALGRHFGYPPMTWWRLRVGLYDCRISEAQQLADCAGWPVSRMFEQVTHDA
ncbi:hypothetical protein OOJ91_11925 [Micromonospora lupini]|uniref:hypothetical protein n=1 Tax=Micromonospora lupini TaxID=285679 RepID=UPI00224F468E|nr:hypothetical protein [Micromonospora lupini]MCX5066585.1 hypothetical protein [Micromonospora lupini]